MYTYFYFFQFWLIFLTSVSIFYCYFYFYYCNDNFETYFIFYHTSICYLLQNINAYVAAIPVLSFLFRVVKGKCVTPQRTMTLWAAYTDVCQSILKISVKMGEPVPKMIEHKRYNAGLSVQFVLFLNNGNKLVLFISVYIHSLEQIWLHQHLVLFCLNFLQFFRLSKFYLKVARLGLSSAIHSLVGL